MIGLLAALAAQLALTSAQESQTWDEGDHIFAGYMQWKRADFGLNPEHPPLVKLLAAAPLTFMRLWEPTVQNREFKHEASGGFFAQAWPAPKNTQATKMMVVLGIEPKRRGAA